MPPEDVQHEVETMMARVKRMGDGQVTAEYVNELSDVESKLADHAGAAGSFASKALVDEIGSMRASLCVEQGFQQHETSECETFMRVVCSLQGNGSAASSSPSVSAESCHSFFLENKQEADTEGRAESISAQAAEESQEQAEEVVQEASNSSENGSAPGFFGGKKGRALPDQGYGEYEDGRKVQHTDMNTSVENWLEEGEGRSISAICKEFPDNEWCQLHTQPSDSGRAPGTDHTPAGNDVVHFGAEPAPPAVSVGAAPVHFQSQRAPEQSGSVRSIVSFLPLALAGVFAAVLA